MAASIRLYVKKQLRLDRLNFRQSEMYEIGQAGLDSVLQRLAAAKGPNDGPAKPLTKRYAIYKSKKHLGNRRNLRLTGAMLSNLKLRTVSDNSAKAALTSRKEREKGRYNMRREEWLVFSRANAKAVYEKAKGLLSGRVKRMVVAKKTGIDVG